MMKTFLAVILSLVCASGYAQQPPDPVRLQGMLDSLQQQLAQANASIAVQGGEIAVLKTQLKEATDKAATCK